MSNTFVEGQHLKNYMEERKQVNTSKSLLGSLRGFLGESDYLQNVSEGQLWFKIAKQTIVGSRWGSGPNGRIVGATGWVSASYWGDPVGQGVLWSLTLNVLPPHILKTWSIHPSSPEPEPAWWGRKHWGTTKHLWLLDLVTLKPTRWTSKPVFHSVSPTIICNTCLLTHSTDAGVYANASVLKTDGALCTC